MLNGARSSKAICPRCRWVSAFGVMRMPWRHLYIIFLSSGGIFAVTPHVIPLRPSVPSLEMPYYLASLSTRPTTCRPARPSFASGYGKSLRIGKLWNGVSMNTGTL